jgi:eukaryotic-like serine/threonine-protein kinase
LRYTDFVIESGESRPPRLGRYELITRIGQGGMAEVQLALQRGPAGFEKLVVVKLVHENLASQKAFVDMLLDEARVAALVKHPNVVDIYDLGEAEGRYFIAMEYLEGEPLLAVLRAGREGQRLDVLSTARLIADTAEGLDAAHELRSIAGDPIELVHHDVSLGNIVVLYNGQVKLVDFGVAKATQSATPHTKVQGKFGYMAPEKLRGGPGDRRSDIWSLGCVLWEALTLKRLFRGGNENDTMQLVLETAIVAPSKVNGDVPADFDAIVLRSLERDPARRYPTAKAMAADLEEVLRKHGYAAKNDVIAKYMQTTFRNRIDARKKLLQEVSSKGRASPDVLEAAFHSTAMASGTPILSAGGLVSSRRTASDTFAGKLAGPRLPPPLPRSARRTGEQEPSTFGQPLTPSEPPSVPAVGSPLPPRPITPVAPLGSVAPPEPPEARGVGDDRTEVAPPPVKRGRRWMLAAAGASAIVVAIAIVVVVAGSPDAERPGSLLSSEDTGAHDDHKTGAKVGEDRASEVAAAAPTEPAPASGAAPSDPAAPGHTARLPREAPAPETATSPGAREDAPPGSDDDAPPARDAVARDDADAAAKPRPGRRAQPPRSPSKPADRASAEELVRTGTQAFVLGDVKSAMVSFRKAIQVNASYAPAWRCLGLVHAKQGERAAARNAFQKYLQLAPNAENAAEIRAKLEAP